MFTLEKDENDGENKNEEKVDKKVWAREGTSGSGLNMIKLTNYQIFVMLLLVLVDVLGVCARIKIGARKEPVRPQVR